MPESAISIENVSKTYRIHPAGKAERTATLRDALTKTFRRAWNGSSYDHRIDFHALKNISYNIPYGEVLGIIGNNGAGKSTLLKILSRITEPTSGRITISGKVASLLEVGTGFHLELTGKENIFLNGAILGMSRSEIRKKFDDIVAFSGVEKFLNTPVKRYSSGMFVRLAFSVAAHLEPEILIIDEVLAVGDMEFQNRCLGKMESVAKSGRTVLFVSHQLNSVRQLCTACCLLDQGEIIKSGKTPDVIAEYLNSSSSATSAIDAKMNIYEQPLPVRFLQGNIFDDSGNPSRHCRFGKNWKVEIEFELLEDIPNLIVALGLKTTAGQSIQTCWSEPTAVSQGKYRAVFLQDKVTLESNSYQLVLGFSRENRPILQVNIGNFDILPHNDLTSDFFVARSSGFGAVLNSMSTKISRMED
ncbi:MAG: polysaccharide ABC transporter ATP-binding protein [Verrucomicrobiota bacterium]